MSPVLMRGDLKLSRYVWQATSEMSFDHRILNPCLRRARSEPPHPLKSEIAEVVICPSVYGRFYSGDRDSPRILGLQFSVPAGGQRAGQISCVRELGGRYPCGSSVLRRWPPWLCCTDRAVRLRYGREVMLG